MSSVGLGKLTYFVGADISGVKQGHRETTRYLHKTSRQLNHNQRDWQTWSIRSVAATVAITMAVGKLSRMATDYADSFQSITNKLKITTDSTQELTDATSELFAMANQNRTSVEATVDLYSKLYRSTKELGFSKQKLMGITDTISKAFIVGGATSREMEGAIRQLGQAIASGTLRGEEFNSVSEQAPVIMEAVKAATGETAGSLRKLAAEGAITTEVLITSLEAYKAKIEGDYAKTQATFSQKMAVARNQAIEFVGANQSIKDAVSKAGDVILWFSENIDTMINLGKIAVGIYGGQLVAAMARSVAGKIKAVQATQAKVLADTKEQMGIMKIKAAQVAQLMTEAQVLKAKQASIRAAIAEAGSTSRALVLKRNLTAVNTQLATTEHALAVATNKYALTANVATGATAKLTAATRLATTAVKGLWAAMGGWPGVIITAITSLAMFHDWEDQVEKKTRIMNQALKEARDSFKNLSTEEQNRQMAQTTKLLTDVENKLKVNRSQVTALQQAYDKQLASGKQLTEGQKAAWNSLMKAQSKLLTQQRTIQKAAKNRYGEGWQESYTKATLAQINLRQNAQLASADKVLTAIKESLMSEMEAENNRYQKSLTKATEAYDAQIAVAKQRGQDTTALEAEKLKTLLDMEADHEVKKKEIRDNAAANEQRRQDEIDREKEKKAKILKSVEDRFKSKAVLEQEAYAAERQRYIDAAGGMNALTEEQKQTLQDMEAEHQLKMAEIKAQGEGQGYLDKLRERFMTEQEILQEKYETEMAMLAAHLAAKGEITAEDQELIRQMALAHQKGLTDIDEKQAKKRADIAKKEALEKIRTYQAVATGMLNLAEAFGSKSKKQQKRIRRAQVAIDTAAGISRAFAENDFYTALGISATIVANAKKQLDAINNERMGGAVSTPSTSTTSVANNLNQQQNQPDRTINISMQGNSLFSADQVRELIGMINEQVGDGVTINTGG